MRFGGVCGHGDNRKTGAARHGADALQGLGAVHAGHVHVQEHKINAVLLQSCQSLGARTCLIDRDAVQMQMCLCDQPVGGDIVNHQHRKLAGQHACCAERLLVGLQGRRDPWHHLKGQPKAKLCAGQAGHQLKIAAH